MHLLNMNGCIIYNYTHMDTIIYMSKYKTTNEYILQVKDVHNDKYDYSSVVYKSNKDKINIICPIHGKYQQIASNHLRGDGCPFCTGNAKKTTKEFIKKAKSIHKNKYYYYKTKYKNANTKVIITCPRHGDFKQIPRSHANKGHGCKKCAQELFLSGYNEYHYFKPFVEKLNDTFIAQYVVHYGAFQSYIIDFYSPVLNIAIEYDEKYHQRQKEKDIIRENKIKELLNCEIVRIDDSKFMEDNNYAKEILTYYLT